MRRKTPIITIASFIMASFIAQQVCASGIAIYRNVINRCTDIKFVTYNGYGT